MNNFVSTTKNPKIVHFVPKTFIARHEINEQGSASFFPLKGLPFPRAVSFFPAD